MVAPIVTREDKRSELEEVLRPEPLPGGAQPEQQLLPDLDIALLERCVALPSWQQARRAFRAGISPRK